MKDLYQRNGLEPLESDPVKINNCRSDDPSDNEAAFSILLNPERKRHYDKTFKTLKKVALLRHRYKLNSVGNWDKKYSDFIYSPPPKPVPAPTSVTKPAPQRTFFNKASVYGFAGAAVIVLLLAIAFTPPAPPATEEIQSNGLTLIPKHAIVDLAPIRETPEANGKIVDDLYLYEDINVIKGREKNGWDAIRLNKKDAYVNSAQLANGSGYNSYIENCRSPQATRPAHGTALFDAEIGKHSLAVINPPGEDAVVKLKDMRGKDIVIYYVRGGETLTVDTIPAGEYHFLHATGENFHPSCGHFVDNVNAWQESKVIKFESDLQGDKEYTKTHLFSLKNLLADAERIDPRDF